MGDKLPLQVAGVHNGFLRKSDTHVHAEVLDTGPKPFKFQVLHQVVAVTLNLSIRQVNGLSLMSMLNSKVSGK